MSDLDARYGRRARPRWFWPLIAVVGCSIGVAFAAWVGFQDKPVSARVWGYDVKSDQQIVVTLEVSTPDRTAVTCTVYVQAEDHSIVGEKTIDVSAAQGTRRVEVDLQTERRAVTGVLRACEVTN